MVFLNMYWSMLGRSMKALGGTNKHEQINSSIFF